MFRSKTMVPPPSLRPCALCGGPPHKGRSRLVDDRLYCSGGDFFTVRIAVSPTMVGMLGMAEGLLASQARAAGFGGLLSSIRKLLSDHPFVEVQVRPIDHQRS